MVGGPELPGHHIVLPAAGFTQVRPMRDIEQNLQLEGHFVDQSEINLHPKLFIASKEPHPVRLTVQWVLLFLCELSDHVEDVAIVIIVVAGYRHTTVTVVH